MTLIADRIAQSHPMEPKVLPRLLTTTTFECSIAQLPTDGDEEMQQTRTVTGRPAGYRTEYHPRRNDYSILIEVKSVDRESLGWQDWRISKDKRRALNCGRLSWCRPANKKEGWIFAVHGKFGDAFDKDKATEFIEMLLAKSEGKSDSFGYSFISRSRSLDNS